MYESEQIIYCAHRGHGCVSQNGYQCLHGPKCEPVDRAGRRFTVWEWVDNGQRLATRRYDNLTHANLIRADLSSADLRGVL
jgi:hypothetical protein